jgi:hypothetical protein
MVALTAGNSPTLGNIWRITAKGSDFYLDPIDHVGVAGAAHLSVHGPNDRFTSHRFHIKVDPSMAEAARQRGVFIEHGLSRKGFAFDGKRVAKRAFCVARIRWTWHLQRHRFRDAAASRHVPELDDYQLGMRQSEILPPNEAWDVDFVVSYDEPYWPKPIGSLRDNARLGPLRNDAGHWLTGTSFHRSQTTQPTPDGMAPRLPGPGEQPNRISCGGPG